MSVDLEARIRRANLISQDRHLERLYGDDLSHRLLRDIYSKKEGRMSEMTDRPEQVTVEDGHKGEAVGLAPKRAPSRRSPALVPAILTAVIAVCVIVALVARQPAPVVAQTPVEIAEAFMAALNEHDADALFALMTDDFVFPQGDTEAQLRGEIRMEEVQGWTYDVESCVETLGTENISRVQCRYSHTNDLARALGTGPYPGGNYNFSIEEGEITSAAQTEPDGMVFEESIGPFLNWVIENHPEAGEDIYFHYTDDVNLAVWEQYLPEWLASLEQAG
jgi:hypothetical protein